MSNIPENQDNYIDDTPMVDPAPLTALENDALLNALPEAPEEATSSVEEDSPARQEPKIVKKQSVTQQYDINAAVKIKPNVGPVVSLPPQNDREMLHSLTNMPNINLQDSATTRQWAEDIREGMQYIPLQSAWRPTLEDETADFRQEVDSRIGGLGGRVMQLREVENENLKGERALIRVMTHLGLGTVFQTPLWHSGFWISFKPPTDAALVELQRSVMSDKINFGRYSYGMVHSNSTSYTADRLVTFALDHVYDLSAQSEAINLGNIRDHISCMDIPSLLWGLVCTMYPNGFRYRRACASDPEKCNYVLEETLNLMKLQWTNNAALTEWQRNHMASRRSKSMTEADIRRYRQELLRSSDRRITIGEERSISFTLTAPSAAQHIAAGHRWISDIVKTVETGLGADAKSMEREAQVERMSKATQMRQYCHWVKSIDFAGNTIDDYETVENTLNHLSLDDTIRNTFLTEIAKYMNEATVAVIGIPTYDCPSCGKTQDSPLKDHFPHHTNVIPLDLYQLFFELLSQRIDRIQNR